MGVRGCRAVGHERAIRWVATLRPQYWRRELEIAHPAIRGPGPEAHVFHKFDVEGGSHWVSDPKGTKRRHLVLLH